MRTVLVPLDGSPLAEAILPVLVRLGAERVVALRVVPCGPGRRVLPPELTENAAVEDLREARAYLLRLAERLAAGGLEVDVEVRTGDPAPTIVEAARELGADLIAMTTHGRGGWGRLLAGSVTEAVLRAAPVPVLALRAAGDEAGGAGPVATPAAG